MRWVARAALAAALLNCAAPRALAANDPHWLSDPQSHCAVFDGNARDGDTVSWVGDCIDGLASGPGTAQFSRAGSVFESFSANFAKGVAQDGHVVAHWGAGWSYDGNSVNGQFNGLGVLINDSHDRFEGNWVDGKMNGQGTLLRANGDRYEGGWKDDQPNGFGILKHADGSVLQGNFADGKLQVGASNAAATNPVPPAPADAKLTPVSDKPAEPPAAEKPADTAPADTLPSPAISPLAAISGKKLLAIDGSSIALTLIDGGIEREISDAGGAAPRKTTFAFMNDRMGTVVEDGGQVSNVIGFFRLTDTGVEVRYADGRSEILSANDGGGVLVVQEAPGSTICRNWYPEGHAFSDADKKAALAAYASKLGLQPAAAPHSNCPAGVAITVSATPPHAAPEPKPRPKPSHVAFIPASPPGKLGPLENVAVRDSVVHAIDGGAPITAGPVVTSDTPATTEPSRHDASHCLKVDSDGQYWGFRNACGFAVQFAYCLMHGDQKLTACEGDGSVNSVTGSVAAGGFGALSTDKSLSEKDTDHDFRWVACDGGAGEVAARLDHADPPSGRCERAVTAAAQ